MFVGFDPRPPTNRNFIKWTFICEWCHNYWRPFWILKESKVDFKCTCGNHPTSRYKKD
jgi:hypothetical protein